MESLINELKIILNDESIARWEGKNYFAVNEDTLKKLIEVLEKGCS